MFIKVSFPHVVLLFTAIVSLSACKSVSQPAVLKDIAYKSEDEINRIKSKPDQCYTLFDGTFVRRSTGANGDVPYDFVYTYVPIFTEVWGEHWLYSESAISGTLEEPVEQLVMKIEKHNKDTFYIYNYRIKNSERFTTGWYYRDKLKALEKEDLVMLSDECYSIGTQNEDGSYDVTDIGYCHIENGSTNRSYYQSTITLNYDGMGLSTTFFDKDKKLSREPLPDIYFKRDLSGKYYKAFAKKLREKAVQ